MKPPEFVGGQTAALATEDEHAAGQSAGGVSMERPWPGLAPQQIPGRGLDVPPPAVAALLQIRHAAVDVHGVAVQHCRVLVASRWTRLARREQVPRLRLCFK